MDKKKRLKNIPETIGVIPDGNRRHAKSLGKSSLAGHQEGYKTFQKFFEWAEEAGVKNVVIYTFSSENWNRSKREVSYLMNLFRKVSNELLKRVKELSGQVRFIGEKERLPHDLREKMEKIEKETGERKGMKVYFALSYGGRGEILSTIKKLSREKSKKGLEHLTEKEFSKNLFTGGMPDPDIIIRTGGEHRLSNFLPWQSAYSELFFTNTLWPAFTKREFLRILDEYAHRERRFGT